MELQIDMLNVLEDAKELDIPELATKYGVSITEMVSKLQGFNIKPADTPKDYKFGIPSTVKAGTRGEEKKKTVALLHTDGDFDNYYQQYKQWLGWNKSIIPNKTSRSKSGEELTVVVGDLHVPYHNEDAVKWMINRTASKAKRLVIGGDLADMFWCSRYMKFKQYFSGLEEVKRVQASLAAFSEAYEEVILMRGNHDDRFIKYLQRSGMSLDALEVFKYLYGEYALHPTYVFAHGLPNVQIVEPLTKDYAEFTYLYQQGDCVISHAEKYSQQTNKVAEDVIKTLMSYHVPQGILSPFKVLIQCHTHMAGHCYHDFSIVGIENGCMALTPDYSGNAKFLPRRVPTIGYTELVQVNGRSDLEKTRFIPYQG
jgi:UDP-2,3-diacylglucosamine pyrophosphatase LpxH